MHAIAKGIVTSIWLWILIKLSDRFSGNKKYRIHNKFLYGFIWIWHSYGEISLLGMICAIGVQVTDIVIVLLLLFSNISRELLGAYWYTVLIVVLFISGAVGIAETGVEAEKWLEKILMFLISLMVLFVAGYFLYPMLQSIFGI